jgi:hypothetical protein
MQVSINGILTACSSISSDMVANNRRGVAGSIAAAIEAFGSLASPIPFAQFGLDLLKTALNNLNNEQQINMVNRVQNFFFSDISLVAEKVARWMALYRQAELEAATTREQLPAFRQGTEALRRAVSLCLNGAESDPSKVRATSDAQTILQAIMDGELVINANSSSGRAEAITAAIVAFVRTKRF